MIGALVVIALANIAMVAVIIYLTCFYNGGWWHDKDD